MDGEEARDASPAFDVFAPDWPNNARLAGASQAASPMPGFEEAERELFGHSQTPLDPGPPAGSLNRSQSALQLPSPPPADPWDQFQGDRHAPGLFASVTNVIRALRSLLMGLSPACACCNASNKVPEEAPVGSFSPLHEIVLALVIAPMRVCSTSAFEMNLL